MVDGITRLAVEGFKSISQKQSTDIAPLTILAGANKDLNSTSRSQRHRVPPQKFLMKNSS